MAKKRTSLDSILTPAARPPEHQPAPPITPAPKATLHERRRPDVKQQTVYLPIKVHEQLRRLAFEERAKMHDYLLEGLDLVFRARGLRSIADLTGHPQEAEEGWGIRLYGHTRTRGCNGIGSKARPESSTQSNPAVFATSVYGLEFRS